MSLLVSTVVKSPQMDIVQKLCLLSGGCRVEQGWRADCRYRKNSIMKESTAIKSHTAAVISHLEEGLNGSSAHASFNEAVKNVSFELLGVVPAGLPYSIWQLVEHVRITQWDILEFSRSAEHVTPEWPKGFWPAEKAPGHAKEWKQSLDQIEADRKAFIELLHRAGEKIYEPFSYGDGQSLFREAVLIIDHTSYHTGEIIVLRRLLKDWK